MVVISAIVSNLRNDRRIPVAFSMLNFVFSMMNVIFIILHNYLFVQPMLIFGKKVNAGAIISRTIDLESITSVW